MFTGVTLAAGWPALLIAIAIGFVLGWLIMGLPARRKSDRYQAEAIDLTSRLKTSERSQSDARQHEQELQSGMDAVKADLEQTTNRLAASDAANAELKGQVASLQGTVQEAQDAFTALQQQMAARDDENAELKLQVSTLRSSVQQAQDAFVYQLEPLQARVRALTEENNNVKANVEGLSTDLSMARADHESMTQTLANKETALTEAYARAVRLQREVTDQQNQLVAAQTEVVTLKRNLGVLQTTNHELNNRLEDARGEVASELAVLTSTMLRAKDEQLSKATSTIEALYAQLSEAQSARPSSS